MLLYTFCSRTLLGEKLLSSRFCYTLLTTLSTSKGEIIELSVVVAQLANRQFAHKEALEVIAYVRCSVAVSVERDHAVLVVATPQSSHFLPPFLIHFLPGCTFAQAAAACFGCVRSRSEAVYKVLRQLAHQAYPNAGLVALIACHPRSACYESPRSVG